MRYGKRVEFSGALCLAAALVGCSAGDEPASHGSDTPLEAAAAVSRLKGALPKARVRVKGDRIRRVYGPSATGKTPFAAAERFREQSAAAFGVDPEDLESAKLASSRSLRSTSGANGVGLMYDRTTGKYKFRLFSYEQRRDGVPVFRSSLRTLVREGNDNPVVWANADLRPMGDFRVRAYAPRSVDLGKSLDALKNDALAPSALTNVSTPTSTIFAGVGTQTVAPRLAVTYTAEDANGPGKWTFVADAETGHILHVESNLHFDVTGSVRAEVTSGSESMECSGLATVPLPHAEVTSAAASAFTDPSGAFTLVQSGSAAVTVTSSVSGRFFDVSNDGGDPSSLSLVVTPPGPADFLHRDTASPPELVLAELNAYQHVNELRDLLLTYLPDYPVISEQLNFPVTVNHTDSITCDRTGGAWYDNDSTIRSINFCPETAERANTAFGGIIHHEYGHHIIDMGGSNQSEYGEGMADAIAMLVSKDPRIAVGYYAGDCDRPLRHAENDCQYSETDCSSCGSGIYECGAVLTGTIWDIWQELDVTEPATSDELIRSLVLSSIPMHTGDAIDPSIAVDFLTLDDDDELIENGTPHYAEICAGFARHGMDCPPVVDGLVVKGDDFEAEGPSDGPFEPASASFTLHNLGPSQTLAYSVTKSANAPWLVLGTTSGSIPLGESVTVTVSIDQAQAALLEDGDYTAQIDFVNQTNGTGNVSRTVKLRVGAPVPVYTADFDDGNEGFTVDGEIDNLWHRATTCVDTLAGHSAPGSLYYGKPDVCNYATPTPIPHSITSPSIAIADPLMAELGFNYFLETEHDPNYDTAEVRISVNGGPFQVVASNNSGGEPLTEGSTWRPVRFPISDLLPAGPSNIRIQLFFNAVDPRNNTRRGFAVDDLVVYTHVDPCIAEGTCPVSGAFLESNGRVVIEAEHFATHTPRSSRRWDLVSHGQASGQALMTANPNSNQVINTNYTSTSPELVFPVRFVTPGTYYVWIRGLGPSADDDSLHVGIDGAGVASADRITGFNNGLGWSRSTMDGPVATLQVGQAGLHDVNVWMREDGFSFDKLVLTRTQSFTPTGTGPAESDREGPRPCADHCSNPTRFTFTNSYQSGNLGTGATCHETTSPLHGGTCGNFVNPRKLLVNGVQMPCNYAPWPSLPAAKNGGYCIQTTGGNHAYAAFTTW